MPGQPDAARNLEQQQRDQKRLDEGRTIDFAPRRHDRLMRLRSIKPGQMIGEMEQHETGDERRCHAMRHPPARDGLCG